MEKTTVERSSGFWIVSDGADSGPFLTEKKALKELEKMEILKESDLNQFTGTEHHYLHPLTNFKYTDGVQYVAEKGKAYWLLDAIFSYNRKEPFQIWELEVNKNKGILTMKEDSDKPILVKQKFGYTDFPLTKIQFYLIDGVLILPSEY